MKAERGQPREWPTGPRRVATQVRLTGEMQALDEVRIAARTRFSRLRKFERAAP